MPISPRVAKENARVRTTPPLVLISKIDDALSRGERTFAVPQVVADQYVLAIITDYTLVGWHVQRISDQRDGDYLEFKG